MLNVYKIFESSDRFDLDIIELEKEIWDIFCESAVFKLSKYVLHIAICLNYDKLMT